MSAIRIPLKVNKKYPYLQESPLIEDNYSMVDLPPYASGSYLMSIITAIDLSGVTMRIDPYFIEEDAFLTGMCAQLINVSLIHDPSFVVQDPPMPLSWDTYR